MKTIAFFNNKGGVGKTSLVYHLSWMYAELGVSVIAADFDPQANLTAMFLPEERLEELWPDGEHPDSVLGCIAPFCGAPATSAILTLSAFPNASASLSVILAYRLSKINFPMLGRDVSMIARMLSV